MTNILRVIKMAYVESLGHPMGIRKYNFHLYLSSGEDFLIRNDSLTFEEGQTENR